MKTEYNTEPLSGALIFLIILSIEWLGNVIANIIERLY